MAFVTAQKRIATPADMPAWRASKAYKDYMHFIMDLNKAVMGKTNSGSVTESEAVTLVCAMLETLRKWIDDIPPIQQPQRFGNQAFRTYHARLVERSAELLCGILPESSRDATVELQPYLLDSFGNSTRIDYGTGHEANFIMFLLCLWKLGVFQKTDATALVTSVFKKYLELCRHLQLTYKMEPAGSHGVWSLDDFQFVPFIWGSAQLIEHPNYDTKCYLDEKIVERSKDDFLWMGCIDFIGKVKSGPFAEHSNQLWSISDVPSWGKVNSGLVKMYEAEVLQKFPVAQHFLFGSLLSFDAAA
ncbi:serine/threonine-protein phosphatase 2A activator-like [Paramacrobiotus metropolitanus]|uniref:serine/threonine-protein phosphatase 2A activator-like n=1 Tax=Paramacrobiotus metropolitanus TaxID=2943436 RepID=UPI0024460FA0|nr:serine/threonine-protein phosphatase 2A activator-like [Paramacrobiotus metropolitanus]